MAKDGRPSLINDIRLFCGSAHSYLEGHEEAVAFGRRIALLLNSEGFSLGAYPALYLLFTSALPVGAVEVTSVGGEWWQRYTHVGVPAGFPDIADSNEIVTRGIVNALLTIRPDQADLIRNADAIVTRHGENLRFLLKVSETKRFVREISFSIGVWRNPSHLFISVTDKNAGTFSEAAPIPLRFYTEAFDLAGSISVKEAMTTLNPNRSFRAELISAQNGGPLSFNEADFFQKASKPVMTKKVKLRG